MRQRVKTIFVGIAVLAVYLTTTPAAIGAGPDHPATTAGATLVTSGAPSETDVAAGCTVWRYNYKGTMKCGTHVAEADFNMDGSVDESWVVAPSRTIWHAWKGSGGWHEMPNDGRADNTNLAYVSHNGHRVIQVWANRGLWWSWRDNNGTWNGWYHA